MKVSLLAFGLGFLTLSAHAAPNWEVCLDTPDYTLTVNDSFLSTVKVAKTGCVLRFLAIGGRGEKLEINLCDANIHVDQYAAIDATEHSTYYAGSAGCPSPMFGADFNERADDLQKYDTAKARVMELLGFVNRTYGKNASQINLEKIQLKDLNTSEAKTACTNYLTKTYLDNCTSFEAGKAPAAPSPAPPVSGPLPPGVHPADIKK